MLKQKNLFERLLMYFVGLFIITVGIAISVKANLGVSSVSAIPYTFTVCWGIEMGKAIIVFHCMLVALQIMILRRNFKPQSLLQIPVGIVFGYFTTFCNSLMNHIPIPENLLVRIAMSLISIILSAIGIFLYLPAGIMPLAGEGFMQAVSDTLKVDFPKVKIGTDITMVMISIVTCLMIVHKVESVGLGTILDAALCGTILGVITKTYGNLKDKI